MKFKVNDIVVIKAYQNDEMNGEGRVTQIHSDKHVTHSIHVSNMNMPYCGGVCQWFKPDELIKK